jgi:hypothetical protein
MTMLANLSQNNHEQIEAFYQATYNSLQAVVREKNSGQRSEGATLGDGSYSERSGENPNSPQGIL